ncbi:Ig-like domain repeat protein [Methanobrevibacter sp. TMH8]|uniref:Ig-like domain repeat protein n=1 Tax=Methanobrevibacter sp. TMH8 TaxID=2848611 RepID=UPI001CC8FCA0|nr:Ig-like domain repeat protein [Methanobrevibacter sp. TMH8]MBZ9570964.1 Ig-like domain repeat protein [Methanobrevibacter sp. TMH8]
MQSYIKSFTKIIFSLSVLIILFASLSSIQAVDIVINNDTAGGINGGIDTIGSESDINNTLTLNPGIYNKTSDINTSINFSGKNILIKGNGSSDQVIIDARGIGRIFNITGNSNITFENITFINGYINNGNGGALYITSGTATINNCVFKNNSINSSGNPAYAYGGAIYNSANNLFVNNSEFTNNCAYAEGSSYIGAYAYAYGGAIYNTGNNFIVNKTNFTNNTLFVDVWASYMSSYGYAYGGAIYNNGSNFNVMSSNFIGNNITIYSYAYDNDPNAYGGGSSIFNGGRYSTISNSSFTNSTLYAEGDSEYDSLRGFIAGRDIFNNISDISINYNSINGNYTNKVYFANINNVTADYNWWGQNNISGYTNINTINHYILNIVNTTSLTGLVIGDQVIFKLLVLNTTYDNTGVEYLPYFVINGTINGFNFNSTWDDRFIYQLTINRTAMQDIYAHLDMQDADLHFYVMMTTNSTITINPNNPHIGDVITITGQLANYTNISQINVTVNGVTHLVNVNSTGGWTLTYTTDQIGNLMIIVNLTGNPNYTDFTNSTIFNVLKKDTNSTIVVNPNNTHIGENIVISGQLANYTGITQVNVTVDGITYLVNVNSTGGWTLNYTTINTGNISVIVSLVGHLNYTNFSNMTNFLVNKFNLNISAEIPNGTVGETVNITIKLNETINTTANITIGNKTYNNVVFVDGVAIIPYLITEPYFGSLKVTFSGNSDYNKNSVNVNVNFKAPTKIITDKITSNENKNVILSAKLVDHNGEPLKGKTLKFYVDGKYVGDAITNTKGIAYLKYTTKKAGNFTFKVEFIGDNLFLSSNSSNVLTVIENPNPIPEPNNTTNKTNNNPTTSATMKNTGMPIIAIILILLSSLTLVARKK